MALAVRTLPTSLCLSHRPVGLGLHSSPSSAVPAFHINARPCIRCNAQEEADASAQGVRKELPTHPWSQSESPPSPDPYAGWAPADPNPDRDWKGLLQVGAGIVLAVGFSIASYAVYSKNGRRQATMPLITTQQEQVASTTLSESPDTISEETATIHEPVPEETKQELDEEKETVEPDIENAAELHHKKTAPGQTSLPSEEVGELSADDEEAILSDATFHDTDLESKQESVIEEASLAKEGTRPASSDSLDERGSVRLDAQGIEEGGDRSSKAVGGTAAADAAEPSVPLPDVAGLSSQSPSAHGSPSYECAPVLIVVAASEVLNVVDHNSVPVEVLVDPIMGADTLSPAVVDSKGSSLIESQQQEEKKNRDSEDEGLERGKSRKGAAESMQEPGEPFSSATVVQGDTSAPGDSEDDLYEEADSVLDGAQHVAPSPLFTVDISSEEAADIKYRDGEFGSTNVGEPSHGTESWYFPSVHIPAPSSPSAASQATLAKVVVPAVVDRVQEQALAALQALKVVEPGIEPGAICTRREYARWLIAASSRLARSSASKVFPAMYIESITELAFDDVSVEDPDFPYIQGLAEAGLISSNLSRTDAEYKNGASKGEVSGAFFQPDSPLSRQDLVSWKVAFEQRHLPGVDKKALQEISGFIDIDRIHKDAWPMLAADLSAGEQSIIASAFGFTRRFQPENPTTKAQAAIALTSGDVAQHVEDELARLEAEHIAEEAVRAHIANEIRAQRELDGQFNEELETDKRKTEQAEKMIEELRAELEKVKATRDEERDSLLKDRATVDSERALLHEYRQQADEQLQTLSTLRAEVSMEKETLEKTRIEAEAERQEISRIKTEVAVERKALTLVRLWAENEAKKLLAHGKVLEEARKRWERKEDQGTMDKEDNILGSSWEGDGARIELSNVDRLPVQGFLSQGDDLKTKVNDTIVRSWEATNRVVTGVLQKLVEALQEVGRKAQHLQRDLLSFVGQKLLDGQSAVGQKVQDVRSAVGQKVQDVQVAVVKKAQGVQSAVGDKAHGVKAAVGGVSTNVVEGAKKFVDGCKGEAEKLAHRFKSE